MQPQSPTAALRKKATAPKVEKFIPYPELQPYVSRMERAVERAHHSLRTSAAPPRVAFIGRFSTGKSRLINEIVGEDVLPHDLRECTGQLTEVAYAAHPSAFRGIGTRLDETLGQEISLEEFAAAVDLTRDHAENPTTESAFFRRCVPQPILQHLTLVDTPGWDGTGKGSSVRAQAAITAAAKQSDVCVFVISKPLGEDEMRQAQTLHRHCQNFIFVLNRTDENDAEEVELIKDHGRQILGPILGPHTVWFAVSARWQSGNTNERRSIQEERDIKENRGDLHGPIVHEWDDFVNFMRDHVSKARAINTLLTIRRAFRSTRAVNDKYNRRRQAETQFLRHVPQLRKRMPLPLGPAILEMAIGASKAGQPIPWELLNNVGVTLDSMAPEHVILSETLTVLWRSFVSLASDLGKVAVVNSNAHLLEVLCRISGDVIEDVAAILIDQSKISRVECTAFQRSVTHWDWYRSVITAEFDYSTSYRRLKELWEHEPEWYRCHSLSVRKRLKDAIAEPSAVVPVQ